MTAILVLIFIGFLLLHFAIKEKDFLKELDKKEHPLRIFYPLGIQIYGKLQIYLKKSDKKLKRKIKNLNFISEKEIQKQLILFRCKQVSFVFVAVVVAGGISLFLQREEKTTGQELVFERNKTGMGAKEIPLILEKDRESSEYLLTIQEQQYTEQQWIEKEKEAEKYVQKVMVGENDSLDQVNKKLFFPKKMPNSGIKIVCIPKEHKWIHENGEVDVSEIHQDGVITEIEVRFRYGKREISCDIPIRLVPKEKSEEEKLYQTALTKIQDEEAKEPEHSIITIPQKIGPYTIKTPENMRKQKVFIMIFCGMFSVLLIFREEEQITEQIKERKDQMLRDYPELIHQLVLLLGAGMTLKGALKRISKNYLEDRSKGKERHYVYEEITEAVYEFQAGIPEDEVYRNLSVRMELLPYKRIMELLIQNLKKGTNNLLYLLEQEEMAAFTIRKEQAKRQGEEAATKLLLPMILLLGSVLLLILYPAMAEFHF